MAALIGIGIVFGCFYTIDETRRGVLLRNGAFVEVVQPGLHFKWPIIEDVRKIDMQTHTFTWSKMESYSADQQPANLKVSVTIHVAMDKVPEMYARFRGEQQAAVDRIIARTSTRMRGVRPYYSAISTRVLNSDSAKALTEAIAYDPVHHRERADRGSRSRPTHQPVEHACRPKSSAAAAIEPRTRRCRPTSR